MTRSPNLTERLRTEYEYQRQDKGVDASVIATAERFPLVKPELV
jgi:hypothetical protein